MPNSAVTFLFLSSRRARDVVNAHPQTPPKSMRASEVIATAEAGGRAKRRVWASNDIAVRGLTFLQPDEDYRRTLLKASGADADGYLAA